eukprot:CAMPEP_0185263844 /NCGR_PEP_ID=MMETSP1359-20130426/16908_1 /TAXON_ID=552665 /ORGANISM="Bigelowiella longifila, Strain CCMP242" /LENGTH=246 /DNA_ID=CAMNT_0027851695 /DNA_START=36 /DNA_END=776 /DNA_ORIENTATION=-
MSKQEEQKKEEKRELTEGNWLPLESNPIVLTKFAKRVGLPKGWEFCDIYGTDKELLGMVPQPCAAVVLLFTSSKELKTFKAEQRKEIEEKGQDLSKKLFYITQHDGIGNACGTIATIHAMTNCLDQFEPEGVVKKFMEEWKEKSPSDIGYGLLKAKDIQEVSEDAAESKDAQTATPDRMDNVAAHFIAFVHVEGVLYEMDGRKAFPINHGKTSSKAFLEDAAAVIKKNFFEVSKNGNFNMMALVKP